VGERHALGLEDLADELVVAARVVVDVVDEQRGVRHDLRHARRLGVERSQRVQPAALLDVGGQVLDAVEEGVQALVVGGTVLPVTQGVHAQGELLGREPRPAEGIPPEQDHLRVEHRVVGSERLDADLVELPLPTGLRAFVAEELTGVGVLDGQATCPGDARREGRADDAGGALRAQREGAVALVVEGVHLLLDDVGRPPTPRENTSVCSKIGVRTRS
jgi:hypothetical protein